MADEVTEFRVAVFGETGAGKTALVSSFAGNLKSSEFERNHGYQFRLEYRRSAGLLNKQFAEMVEGRFPSQTQFGEGVVTYPMRRFYCAINPSNCRGFLAHLRLRKKPTVWARSFLAMRLV